MHHLPDLLLVVGLTLCTKGVSNQSSLADFILRISLCGSKWLNIRLYALQTATLLWHYLLLNRGNYLLTTGLTAWGFNY